MPAGEVSFARNAEILDVAIERLRSEHGQRYPGLVVVGHSIGAAITIHLAARRPRWPLSQRWGFGKRRPPAGQLTARVLTKTAATVHGSVERFAHPWGVACWTTVSPATSTISRSPISSVSSPESTTT